MRYRGHNVEIIERGTKTGEYRRCQVAIDGIPCVPFDVHEADFLGFHDTASRNAFLARQGMSLVDTYGDYRRPQLPAAADSHLATGR